jgi:hypothetical protein
LIKLINLNTLFLISEFKYWISRPRPCIMAENQVGRFKYTKFYFERVIQIEKKFKNCFNLLNLLNKKNRIIRFTDKKIKKNWFSSFEKNISFQRRFNFHIQLTCKNKKRLRTKRKKINWNENVYFFTNFLSLFFLLFSLKTML